MAKDKSETTLTDKNKERQAAQEGLQAQSVPKTQAGDLGTLSDKKRRERYEHLVSTLYHDVYGYGFWVCKSQPLAEDLVQENFFTSMAVLRQPAKRECRQSLAIYHSKTGKRTTL